uniref:Uncharacterized protein n=1 Tax=Peromyscus maniculatus bairdii TaxID=230844 RepID=A0A8C8W7I4_PERMB
MAEDHGLGDGDGPVQVAQGLELLLSVIANDVILFDGVQRLLFTLKFDDVGVWDHLLGFGSSSWLQFLPLDADALVLVALSCYHHISLVQNKHLDLLGVNELQLGAPVQDGPGGANDNLLTDLLTSAHIFILTFIASNSIS